MEIFYGYSKKIENRAVLGGRQVSTYSTMSAFAHTHASKSMTKGQRSSAKKNARRVDAVLGGELTLCTYGKVTKALGNKMFRVLSTKKTEHLARIRGKMMRVNVDDVVLLNIRDYETRSDTDDAVYDIMAIFPPKDVQKLTKNKVIPKGFLQGSDMIEKDEEDELYDLFDYDQAEDGLDEEVEAELGVKPKKTGALSKNFLMEL